MKVLYGGIPSPPVQPGQCLQHRLSLTLAPRLDLTKLNFSNSTPLCAAVMQFSLPGVLPPTMPQTGQRTPTHLSGPCS